MNECGGRVPRLGHVALRAGAIKVQGALAKQKPRLEHVGCGAAGQVRGVCPFGHDAADIKLTAPCPRGKQPGIQLIGNKSHHMAVCIASPKAYYVV